MLNITYKYYLWYWSAQNLQTTFLVTMKDIIPPFSMIFFFSSVFFLKPREESSSSVTWHPSNTSMIDKPGLFSSRPDQLRVWSRLLLDVNPTPGLYSAHALCFVKTLALEKRKCCVSSDSHTYCQQYRKSDN